MQLAGLVLDDELVIQVGVSRAMRDAGFVALRAGNIDEAKQIIGAEQIDFCVFDFFLSKDQTKSNTSVPLIRELRESRPSLPIILMSAASDSDRLEQCFDAGADLFIPKGPTGNTLIAILKAAVTTAMHVRKRELEGLNRVRTSARLFFPPKTQNKIKIISKQIDSNIIIGGEAGTGKTMLAHKLATQFVREHPRRFRPQVIVYDCLGKQEDEVLFELFGTGRSDNTPLRALLESVFGSIVIVENLHALPRRAQHLLLRLFDTKGLELPSGKTVSSKDAKFVFTYRAEEESNIAPGVLNKISDAELMLPSVDELYSLFSELVTFLIKRICHDRAIETPVSVSESVIAELKNFVKVEGLPANHLSLERILDDLVLDAITIKSPSISLLPEALPRKRISQSSDSWLGGFSAFDVDESTFSKLASLKEHIANAKDMDAAVVLLKDLMFKFAELKYGNSRKEICDSLGIAKSTYHTYKN